MFVTCQFRLSTFEISVANVCPTNSDPQILDSKHWTLSRSGGGKVSMIPSTARAWAVMDGGAAANISLGACKDLLSLG